MNDKLIRALQIMEGIDRTFKSSLLLEAMSVSDVYSKYYSNDISEEDFNKIVQADPTTPPNGSKAGRFVKWLMNLYKSNNLKLEDLYKATEYLELFVKFNAKLPEGTKDINRYKSLPQLFNVIKDFQENPDQATSKSDERRKIKSDEAELFYEDDMWKVVIPKTEAAACEYGKNTQWCTSAREDNRFNYYNEDGPLYILINKKNGRKYQFHFESEQFMDENDESIDIIELPLSIGLLKKLPLNNLGIVGDWVFIDNEFMDKSIPDSPHYHIDENGYVYTDGNAINIYSNAISTFKLPQDVVDYIISNLVHLKTIKVDDKILIKTNEVKYNVWIMVNNGNHYTDYNINCFGTFTINKQQHSIFDKEFPIDIRLAILTDEDFMLTPIKEDGYIIYSSKKMNVTSMGDYMIVIQPNKEPLIVDRNGYIGRNQELRNCILNSQLPFKIINLILDKFLYTKIEESGYIIYTIDKYPFNSTFIYNPNDKSTMLRYGRTKIVKIKGDNVTDLTTVQTLASGDVSGVEDIPKKVLVYFYL